MKLREIFATNLRRMRHASGLSQEEFGPRRMRNLCLAYLMAAPEFVDVQRCRTQLQTAVTMEDARSALGHLVDLGEQVRVDALADAYQRWRGSSQKLDHWFAAQAASAADDCVELVRALTSRPDFSFDSATRVKAVFDTFTSNNGALHRKDGEGYRVLAQAIEKLSVNNPRLGARFIKAFSSWERLDAGRADIIARCIREMLSVPDLAPDLRSRAETILGSQP